MFFNVENKSNTASLAVASQETMGRLLEGLNLCPPVLKSRQNPRLHPTLALNRFSEGVLWDVKSSNNYLVSSLTNALGELYNHQEQSASGMEKHKIGAALNGIALIVAVYNSETSQKLVPALATLSKSDVDQIVIPTLKNTIAPPKPSFFRRGGKINGIPKDHLALNEFIRVARNSAITYPGIFDKGANAMFGVLGQVWDVIF